MPGFCCCGTNVTCTNACSGTSSNTPRFIEVVIPTAWSAPGGTCGTTGSYCADIDGTYVLEFCGEGLGNACVWGYSYPDSSCDEAPLSGSCCPNQIVFYVYYNSGDSHYYAAMRVDLYGVKSSKPALCDDTVVSNAPTWEKDLGTTKPDCTTLAITFTTSDYNVAGDCDYSNVSSATATAL